MNIKAIVILVEQYSLYSDVFRSVFWFIIVDNMRPVNGHRMCSFNAEASLCVGDAILVASIYILFVFLDIISFEDLHVYYMYFGSCPSVQTNLCVVMFFFGWFGWLISSRPNQLLSTNGGLLLIFNWTCFSNLLYFIPAYILSSLRLNYHQYIIYVGTSRMLHYLILDGIVM